MCSSSASNMSARKYVTTLSILQVAAIGPTTAEALVNTGAQVDVMASKPNAESLVQAIIKTMS